VGGHGIDERGPAAAVADRELGIAEWAASGFFVHVV
jgi:hypothetical protein